MEKIEKDLTDLILEKTGKDITKGDYGFIAGTINPYMEKGTFGYVSSSMINGFEVWKKSGESYEAAIIKPENFEDSTEKIIEFLNQ